MICMMFYSHKKKELTAFRKIGGDIVCKISEEDWDMPLFDNKDEVLDFLSENPIIDISCVDVVAESGIEVAEKTRAGNKSAYIILLADSTVSPMLYIKPSIMAASLMLRPLTVDSVKEVFMQAIREFIREHRDEAESESFVIDNRDGKQFIPYDRIMFFESRNKKIYINTDNEEYCFYDTLDNIEQSIGDAFVRCHRSFIVAKSRIKKIMLSQNTLILDTDYQIPLSRSYKSVVKELR